MGTNKLAVLGSINADHILNLEHFPRPGETLIGKQYRVAFGGKGANQAVAAGRSGADITFIACVGEDDIGERIRGQLRLDNVDIQCVEPAVGSTTGVALIFVNDDGENMIGIDPGANAAVTPDYLARCGTPQTVDELKDHSCLTVRNLRSGRMVDWQFMSEGKVQDVSVEGRLIFDSGDALVDGAVGGFGIAQVMDFAVREAMAAGRLVPLLEDVAGRSRAISLVYPPSRQYSPKLMAFAQALANARW